MLKVSIKGVIVKKLKDFRDERGWLTEIYREDESDFGPKMSYVSHTNYKQVRGPHEHKKQMDYLIFIGYGDFDLYLWDNRDGSDSYGKKEKMIVGESNKVAVIIPPGIVHGYKSLSKNGSLSINLPDKLYKGNGKKKEADEIRHEDDKNSIFKIE